MYSPSEGEVLLNGKNIKELSQNSIRQKVSMVNQNPAIFNMSLKENILMNKTGVSDDTFLKAVDDARVDEIIQTYQWDLRLKFQKGE